MKSNKGTGGGGKELIKVAKFFYAMRRNYMTECNLHTRKRGKNKDFFFFKQKPKMFSKEEEEMKKKARRKPFPFIPCVVFISSIHVLNTTFVRYCYI